MFKTANIGSTDRILRIVVGLALVVVAYLYTEGWVVWLLAAIGWVLILTALVRFCPLYRLIGTSTAGR